VGFLDFCEACKKLHVAVDVPQIFGADSPDSLTLDELAPAEGKWVAQFQDWMARRFGGPSELFGALESLAGEEIISCQAFVTGLRSYGFEGGKEALEELFHILDLGAEGEIQVEDFMFFEADHKARESALLKRKWKAKHQAQQKMLVSAYRAEAQAGLPQAHRLAQRLWNAASVERLPEILQQKRKDRRHDICIRTLEARRAFHVHLCKTFGNEVRAWRRGLDPKARFYVTKKQLGSYCRAANLKIDFASLWKALDGDSDGFVRLEEIGSQPAALLARFRNWARRRFEACAEVWDQFAEAASRLANPSPSGGHGEQGSEAGTARTKQLEQYAGYRTSSWSCFNRKLRYSAFMKLLRALGWQGEASAAVDQMLCSSLDFHGCGFISQSDLEWLDSWRAPVWLYSDPDPKAWEQLKGVILRRYHQPLKAWRQIFDTDDSNQVCWVEFEEACRKLDFAGNLGGAWRYLDRDVSGTISLHEFDLETAELLVSFKEWIEEHYGCVEFAFKSMDSDGSGTLTFMELKRACRKLGWGFDVEKLFTCLDVNMVAGKRTLTIKHLDFLDAWSPEESRDSVTVVQADATPTHKGAGSPTNRLNRANPQVRSLPALGVTAGAAEAGLSQSRSLGSEKLKPVRLSANADALRWAGAA
jgi:Ca2+-binding EF-hand superfamily protein